MVEAIKEWLVYIAFIGGVACLIIVLIIGRHIIPQSFISLAKDIKHFTLSVLKVGIQERNKQDNPNTKDNLTKYNPKCYAGEGQKDKSK